MQSESGLKSKVLVTGAAGFIGSLLIERLLSEGKFVVGVDNLSNGSIENLSIAIKSENFEFYKMDCTDVVAVTSVMENVTEVWHLAANTDIITAHGNPMRDFQDCAFATFCVLEAMRIQKVPRIIFSSSGSVYGALSFQSEVTEKSAPLKPLSTYGAGKLASEAFISSYCNLYSIQGFIFRFGNVIGGRISHGVIFDFVRKLSRNPENLVILGNGMQTKNYFLAKDCIDGMLFLSSLEHEESCVIINLGAQDLTNVQTIAKIVIDEMSLKNTVVQLDGAEFAWPGDQPIVRLNCNFATSLGWRCATASDDAVRIATKEILEHFNRENE